MPPNDSVKNLPNKVVRVEADVVAPPEPVSTLQRFRIHVPNPYTHLLLGQRQTASPAFGYTGMSLQADDNLFADIKKDTILQTHGFVLMQSGDLWQQYAAKLMELSSPTAVKVVGGNVFLGALAEPKPPAFKNAAGEELLANDPNNLQPLIDHLMKTASNWDTVASVLGLIHTGLFLSPPSDLDGWIKLSETTFSALKKFYDMGKKYLGSSPPKKDVNIYGLDGVNVMSPAKVSITAMDSVKVFASMGVSMTSGLSSTLQAAQGVKCLGGLKASLESGVYADVKTGRELGIACLRGKVKVKGKEIEIGTHDPKLNQVATEKVKVKATKEVLVDSKEALNVKTGKSTQVEAKENVVVKADKAVQIIVGKFCIEVKPDGIKIGKGSDGTPSDPMISIDGDTIAIHSSGMGMKVEKKRVHIGKAGTNMSVSDSGNIFVKGSVIKLG